MDALLVLVPLVVVIYFLAYPDKFNAFTDEPRQNAQGTTGTVQRIAREMAEVSRPLDGVSAAA